MVKIYIIYKNIHIYKYIKIKTIKNIKSSQKKVYD